MINPTPQAQYPHYGQRHPTDAYPYAIYSDQNHVTPDTIRAEATERSISLRVHGLYISVDRHADNGRLAAGEDIAYCISQAAEQFGAHLRAERERREREAAEEQAAAAQRAAEHQPIPPQDRPGPAAPQDPPGV